MDGILLEAVVALLLIVLGFGVGRVQERRHLLQLASRERALSKILVTDLRTPPPHLAAVGGTLVTGGAVIASDYFKTFASGIRGLIGGEMGSYQKMLDRARRESRARMLEQARRLGAPAVINVRFETSEIGGTGPMSEILCYGTAVLTSDSRTTIVP